MYNILYQINPMCKEEHIWWIIRLTDEEQQILDYSTVEESNLLVLNKLERLLTVCFKPKENYTRSELLKVNEK